MKNSTKKEAQYAGYIGAALVIFGSLLPWVETAIVSKRGVDGDGIFSLILGLAALGLVYTPKSYRFSAGIIGALILILSGYHIYDISLQASQLLSEMAGNPFAGLANIKVGIGLYLVFIGAIGLIVHSALRAKKTSK